MSEIRKVGFYTLGCKLNFSESSTIARQFEQGGFQRVANGRDADICIVNTCSVTEHADKKCRNLIRKIHRENPSAIIAVTGCYAQLKPQEIAAIEGVDIVIDNNSKGSVFERVSGLSAKGAARIFSCETDRLTDFFAAFSSGDRTRAFLKVQDGCDYKCAYCTIHYARGSSRNMPIDDVVAEAERIALGGQKEIVITGVNTGDFGKSTGETFIGLLRRLDKVDGIKRYRISSIEPNLLTDEVIEFCSQSSKFQPHFHIPIQSGCDEILGAMRRRYTTTKFAERIASVRRFMPDAFIGIDVIVGFPGETDSQFETTYSFLRDLSPAYLHVFPFSERELTPAATMPDKVRDSVKTERAKRLDELCKQLHKEFYRKHVGQLSEVLFEGSSKGGFMFGYTGNYIKVKVPYCRSMVNTICTVRLTGVDENCEMTAEMTAVGQSEQ